MRAKIDHKKQKQAKKQFITKNNIIIIITGQITPTFRFDTRLRRCEQPFTQRTKTGKWKVKVDQEHTPHQKYLVTKEFLQTNNVFSSIESNIYTLRGHFIRYTLAKPIPDVLEIKRSEFRFILDQLCHLIILLDCLDAHPGFKSRFPTHPKGTQ